MKHFSPKRALLIAACISFSAAATAAEPCDKSPCSDESKSVTDQKNQSSSNMIGRFNTSTDLLLANFDSKPDPDDIHAVAALATMLKNPRFAHVNYHAVSGAYGTQKGRYIIANTLFDLSFGASHWSNAHLNHTKALNEVYEKVSSTLKHGGDIWVQEAGQADFTADLVHRIQQQNHSINTQERIHVVQHSKWNEEHSTQTDLSFIKSNTDYKKIPDGNSIDNGSPGFNTKNTSFWPLVLQHPQVSQIWHEAKAIADQEIRETPGWKNPSIKNGGMDFSDAVENAYIFGYIQLRNTRAFFEQFL